MRFNKERIDNASSDTSIENPIEEGSQLFTKNITEDTKIRESDQNQSTTSYNNSSQSCNNNENRGEISTSEINQTLLNKQRSTQSYHSHENGIYSIKQPLVDYNFPTKEQYESHLAECSATAQNLELLPQSERKQYNKSSILVKPNDSDITKAHEAEGSIFNNNQREERLSENDKLYKCLFDVCRPVLRERLASVVTLETRQNFSKYLEHNKHYFFHHFKPDITCECKSEGPNKKCKVLQKVTNKVGKMTKSVFYNLYEKKGQASKFHKHDKDNIGMFCLYTWCSKKIEIKDLDFNDL
ncbi:unnamed protein product [Mytilus coruscus]|uniref:Uncharacterized protein n=1 Tax=Mytilus coruscus TaxID=42192 RepID=A0A6J8E3S7_MYTCO|nr:unnamed protein product [Mytilus coruscus]